MAIKPTLKHIARYGMLGLVGWSLGYGSAVAENITTVTLTQDTLQALPNCVHYQVVGVCFWLVCGLGGCSIETTLKVDHYLPDLVDTVYPTHGHDPWIIVNKTIDVADHAAGNATFSAVNGMTIAGGAANTANSQDGDLKFREVDVIGNPALAVLHSRALLSGQATPMLPYYQSQLDAVEWRSGALEQLYPETWIPGDDVVGTALLNDWGSVYPREGFLLQDNIGKASAVYAVRGGNVATTSVFDHVAVDLNSAACPEEDCTTAGPILSDTPKIEWQMVLPDSQTSCHAAINYTAEPDWVVDQPSKQAFSWIIWREYRGCLPGDGTYLGSSGG